MREAGEIRAEVETAGGHPRYSLPEVERVWHAMRKRSTENESGQSGQVA